MSNRKVVETYIDVFNKTDHAQILSCLADDITWEGHGAPYWRSSNQLWNRPAGRLPTGGCAFRFLSS